MKVTQSQRYTSLALTRFLVALLNDSAFCYPQLLNTGSTNLKVVQNEQQHVPKFDP
jgi:hypothetical protein